MPCLIVNADDFGYTAGVNQSIVELHAAGRLTSTTLMATGAALQDALAHLNTYPVAVESRSRLGVGCHVVLVDGIAASPRPEIRSLVGRAPQPGQGREMRPAEGARFRPTLGGFVVDLLRGRIEEVEIEREAVAQIRRLQASGILVTHLDTHKHTHMFPRVLRPLLRAALECGVGAIRNPFEPAWSVRATGQAPLVRQAEVRLVALLRPRFARLVAEAGLRTTAGAIGVLATGTLDGPTLEQLLSAALREAGGGGSELTWELVCHPGYHDAALAAQPTRLLAARETERTALLGAGGSLLGRFRLIHFGELS
jgi:predicted glycoside hydrolase/deacetylase ChbG (UPF0249 family)